jgi:rRNA maturation endonuclease Nob1
MPDLLQLFKDKAEEFTATITRAGGVSAMLQSLRQQMADADRRRAMSQLKAELKRLDSQINEMALAVGVQAIGLHRAGRLSSPELAPLCQHIVDLENALSQQKADLAKLEADDKTEAHPYGFCATCGKPLPEQGIFCPHCGATIPTRKAAAACDACGAVLRPSARFCAKCGHPAGS